MATPLTGIGGVVEVEGTAVDSMRSWSLTRSGDPQEVGGFGDGWERNKPGRLSWEASVEGIWAYGSAGQAAIEAAFLAQTLTTFTFGEDATHLYVGEGYINNLEVGAEFDGVTTFNYDVSGDGPLTTVASHA